MLKEKASVHRNLYKCKMKSINQCGTEPEYNVFSINAEKVKMKKY